MKNRTAIFLSAAMVVSTAAVSGVVYASASQAAPAIDEPAPATEVVVEFVDSEGNVVEGTLPAEATAAAGAEEAPNANHEGFDEANEPAEEYEADKEAEHDEENYENEDAEHDEGEENYENEDAEHDEGEEADEYEEAEYGEKYSEE